MFHLHFIIGKVGKMALFQIHKDSLKVIYSAHYCSKASIFYFLVTASSVVIPFLISYNLEGFWKKTTIHVEQPTMSFKYHLMFSLDIQNNSDISDRKVLTWSSFQKYNTLMGEHVRQPQLQAYESDLNDDSKYDNVNLQLKIPLSDDENIHGVKLLLLFTYSLHEHTKFAMESIVYIEESSSLAGSRLDYVGDIVTIQKHPLHKYVVDRQFNESLFNLESPFSDDYDMRMHVLHYAGRNMSTAVKNTHSMWTSGKSSTFDLNIILHYVSSPIEYRSGLWQLILWAWVQYIAFLIPSLYLADMLKGFVFINQIVPCAVKIPFANKY